MTEIVAVMGDDFSGASSHDGNAIHAWMKGNADYAALDALETLLSHTHSKACQLGTTQVVLDVYELEFMSSSCLRSVVTWIAEIQELDEPRRYRVTVISNPKRHWQRRSLHTLRTLALELISISER